MTNILFLTISLIGLCIGTGLIVKSAEALAKHFQVRETFIGLSILAFGTDLPELAIMLDASLFPLASGEEASIIVGSALGSAIGQIGFVLGVTGLIGTPFLARKDVKRHGSILLFSIAILMIFTFGGTITRLEGVILTLLYLGYFIFLFRLKSFSKFHEEPKKVKSFFTAWMMIIIGFILLLGNAKLAINTTIAIAEDYNLSSSAVAVAIIGLGSSLPELLLSGFALAKKKVGLSLGNLIGSNILDTLLVPGIGATIRSLPVDDGVIYIDLPALMFVTLLSLYFLYSSPKGVGRFQSITLIAVYGLYVIFRFGREAFLV